MVVKTIENSIKVIGVALLGLSLIACNPISEVTDVVDGGTTASVDPNDALNSRLGWPAGTQSKTGSFPSPTNLANNISLTSPSSSTTTLSPTTGSANLPISMTNAVPGQATNVNVKFGSGSSFVQIPVSGSTITSSSGTLNVGFSVPSSICDNVSDIEHQISCYEQVTLADGSQVSKETARQMLLACGTGGTTGGGGFATGPSDYCVDGYPQGACTLLNDQSGWSTRFHSGGSCASLYPNSTYLSNYGGTSATDGTCAVQVTTTASVDDGITAADAMNNALIEAVNNPETSGLTITFTPAE